MGIISCPKGKWLGLVENMQECNYDVLIEEPNIPELEGDIIRSCPTITRGDLESTVQFLAGSYHNKNLRIRSEIDRYGETYTEACGTLREHVNSCPGCKTEYLRALDSYTESMSKYHKGAEKLGVTETKDYLDGISEYDFLEVIKKK